jgi:hypothetical protein
MLRIIMPYLSFSSTFALSNRFSSAVWIFGESSLGAMVASELTWMRLKRSLRTLTTTRLRTSRLKTTRRAFVEGSRRTTDCRNNKIKFVALVFEKCAMLRSTIEIKFLCDINCLVGTF